MSKTATFPSIRVESSLRDAAQSVLTNGETLSSFAEKIIRAEVKERQLQTQFIERALASRDNAIKTGILIPADEVHAKLKAKLARAKLRASTKGQLDV